ncbi:preprotein translocase subunit TatB [Streptomyces spongiicola]|uniref:Preprotein translocase subunit TatB n=1 Tax=Streptomyces spongiicola TaxID=1690221 RepID=A0A2S1Z6U6_9ACTN|nr:preprotein translocase subunit TatB [Streptomyces spongiicola]AWK12050.1 preprotein translocase subunit TatB [Streptomyces spongiicola]GBQ02622.1 preprotein translocase subunit TatB [Streptomyces spongiicola]
MPKIARVAAAAAAAFLAGGLFAPAASASSSHPYTCANQSIGVNCSGVITVNDVLNGTTVNIGGISALNGTQINGLQTALANVANNNVNAPVTVQIGALETTAITTLAGYGKTVLPTNVNVCAGSICV